MKTRLNITIEENLLEKVKVFAIKKQTSISQMIENYLDSLVNSTNKEKNILDIIDKLNPDQNLVADSYKKQNFYEQQHEKYGF
ncbi:hypothetical protein A9P82_06250 [Arachidicoccus ginsenosidimutans]|uniref:DUF6364 family protein n=1 Tax=Arachidicoccus sp. BS20 TaxID=1850526 RepID=UPI0007F114B4|nr:DUF6364 family protein [Arachidicoccus sp. BS20]ANI88930.1 hypothetical protein A9P82_06250 [Arachidicoccus sp. BS20]